MNREEIVKGLIESFCTVMGKEEDAVSEQTDVYKDLGCDSLDLIDVEISMEKTCRVDFRPNTSLHEAGSTIGQMADYIMEHAKPMR